MWAIPVTFLLAFPFFFSLFFFLALITRKVRKWYEESFEEIRAFGDPPRTEEEEEQFREMMGNIYARHADTLMTMARGLLEWQVYLSFFGGGEREREREREKEGEAEEEEEKGGKERTNETIEVNENHFQLHRSLSLSF